MKMNKKTIRFTVPDLEFIDGLKPAKQFVPEWYRQSERFAGGKLKIVNGSGNHALKLCVPFLDGMTSGYIATLWTDVMVEQTELGTKIQWRSGPDPIEKRPRINDKLPTPHGHEDAHYAWKTLFQFQTPKGYSALVTHPFNRFDLPFTTLSGVVDSDMTVGRGNLPFFLKKDFEGIIPVGTPIMQILPFKREEWKAEDDKSIYDFGRKNELDTMRHSHSWYKNFKWHRKSYE
jgi:hypothetical protein